MMKKLFLSLVFFSQINSSCAATPKNPWSKFDKADSSTSESIGFYSAGCLAGAQELQQNGNGFQTMRLSRKRYFGHPNLINFIETLAKNVKKKKYGTLLIGDLAQARGGPMLSGHASHQSGLDVDIWYWLNPIADTRKLKYKERDRLSSPEVVNYKNKFTKYWKKAHIDILKMAASDKRVERVLVHPAIKRKLCEDYSKTEWLKKVRPWWGHADHFHVRLKCPENSELCLKQEPSKSADCDEKLAWWFTQDALDELKKRQKAKTRSLPELPQQCNRLLN